MNKILLIYLLTVIANTIDILTYSVCIVGVKTGKLAVSNALFQIVMVVSRIATFIQAPLLGSIADDAIMTGNIDNLDLIFRNVIFMVSIGSLLGGLFTPIFIEMFSVLTNYFERIGTVPKMITGIIFNISKIPLKKISLQPYKKIKTVSIRDLPIRLIILNSLAISVYSVGLVSSIYAGVLAPEYTITANQLSGIVVGGAAALFMIFVDPMLAVITDQTMCGKMSPLYIRSLVFFLIIGDLIGTIISQIIFIPLSNMIIYIAKFI